MDMMDAEVVVVIQGFPFMKIGLIQFCQQLQQLQLRFPLLLLKRLFRQQPLLRQLKQLVRQQPRLLPHHH